MEPNKVLVKELLKTRDKDPKVLARLKRKVAKRLKVPCPSNLDLLKTYRKMFKEGIIERNQETEELLKVRPIRSLSGIVNVSVLTKPYPCPGKCVFCPIEKGFPKSYLSGEPAADRAKALNFNPYWQTKKRIEMLKSQGHPTDKIELRIVGGTWSYYPKRYQTWFITRCFAACNKEPNRTKHQTTLEKEQRKNEKAKHRIVGISIETRPDFVTKKEVKRLRELGVTLVELGAQSLFDDVLKRCRTGLTSEKIAKATKLLKDAGFKVLYQMMPNLPGSTPKKDLESFELLFQDERFKPDWLKIYPCLVCENTLLYLWWKKRRYRPYSKKELVELLIKMKKLLPGWVRLTRLFRDIPAQKITAGCKTSNLREVVQKEMKKRNLVCHCIRCKEIRERYNPKEKIYLFKENYPASGGKEFFLSFENKKRTKLFSFLRLRIPLQKKHFLPVLEKAAVIREVQTFGWQVPISERKLAPQHRGLGKKLIKEAEKAAKREFSLSKMAAISGVGAREYWRKLDYRLKETYMVKKLTD